ncbi:class IV lanthionine synthetase LanL [Actinomadura sp. 7K534]|uniref:class IV lanthionine synthetase LanL n=1 Tax=Actinomadura sp. 7K534 TaxID=2530366 RepID=UPI001A9F08B9|nr:class IV lanthionine synthetase LanL [Actinomadura sp. 7K534]
MADFNFSVFSRAAAAAAESGDTRLADVLDRAVAAAREGGRDGGRDGARWTVRRDAMWCHVLPQGTECPAQGWKLHVSATPASAEEVLARSLAVLLAAGSAFKFAAAHDQVAALNARNTSRGHSGKFITVYPVSDEEAVRLALELHRATAGLPGPRILSDRPYAPGSLVHYRYGAFTEERRITNDGFYTWMILDPDGNPVEDQRIGRYTPPSWVSCPFPDHRAADSGHSGKGTGDANGNGADANQNELLIGTRFTVREAIRHTNKGGVYRALDTETGDPVVLKEARPHVAADEEGNDARDLLRAEARALEAVEHLGLAPRPVRLFTQSGHLFLAEELIPGTTLGKWTADLLGDRGWGPHLAPALEMAVRLTDLMIRAHGAGLIVRDFTPNNIMVRPDGAPILIDLELAVAPGSPDAVPLRAGTPGYAAPEQMDGAAPDPAADRFALGATLCHVLTGGPPYLLDERPVARPPAERLTELLTARTQGLDLPAPLIPLLLGLMADDPRSRWSPDRARAELAAASSGDADAPRPDPAAGPRLRSGWLRQQNREVVAGITEHLLAAMDPEAEGSLWPASCVHGAPDPCSLQHGAAGPLGALTRCYDLTGDRRLPEAIARAGRWILTRLDDGTARPAGLYFGTAGAAWAVLDAGLATDDGELVDGALALADRLPAAVDAPDITHGTAGIGLTALHLWTLTGHARYAERAAAAADALAASVEDRSGRLSWSTPAQHESKLAGRRYYGFAHGVAGVGYFLTACARATGRADHLALAAAVGGDLLEEATVTGRSAMWGAGPGDAPTAPYWCHGAAGIGGFLVRLGDATGDARFTRGAEQAAQAVLDHRWRAPLGQCHGLAGNGDFLLDMAAFTGDGRYRDAAWRFARTIVANRADRDGHSVFPDEFGQVSVTWGDGMSGILAFLQRTSHGTPRLWTADVPDGLAGSAAVTGAGAERVS